MRTIAGAIFTLLLVAAPCGRASAEDATAPARSTRFHLSGGIGLTAAFVENTALAATTLDARFYAPEGLGAVVRVGYEGLVFLNFGVLDAGLAFRQEVPGGQWAGLGLSAAVGASVLVRDSVYHFTGDDFGFALFGTVGADVRLGSLLIGLDVIGRWQLASVPILGEATRQGEWPELGGAIRIGGEVLL